MLAKELAGIAKRSRRGLREQARSYRGMGLLGGKLHKQAKFFCAPSHRPGCGTPPECSIVVPIQKNVRSLEPFRRLLSDRGCHG